MTIIGNGKRYAQTKYETEKDFEEDVVASSKMLFGKNTIYINAVQATYSWGQNRD